MHFQIARLLFEINLWSEIRFTIIFLKNAFNLTFQVFVHLNNRYLINSCLNFTFLLIIIGQKKKEKRNKLFKMKYISFAADPGSKYLSRHNFHRNFLKNLIIPKKKLTFLSYLCGVHTRYWTAATLMRVNYVLVYFSSQSSASWHVVGSNCRT